MVLEKVDIVIFAETVIWLRVLAMKIGPVGRARESDDEDTGDRRRRGCLVWQVSGSSYVSLFMLVEGPRGRMLSVDAISSSGLRCGLHSTFD